MAPCARQAAGGSAVAGGSAGRKVLCRTQRLPLQSPPKPALVNLGKLVTFLKILSGSKVVATGSFFPVGPISETLYPHGSRRTKSVREPHGCGGSNTHRARRRHGCPPHHPVCSVGCAERPRNGEAVAATIQRVHIHITWRVAQRAIRAHCEKIEA